MDDFLLSSFSHFESTIEETPPKTITACQGWSIHELTAHLVSATDALQRELTEFLEGRAQSAWERDETRREGPYRAMSDKYLRSRLFDGLPKVAKLLDEAVQAGHEDDCMTPPSWGLPIKEFYTHLSQEFVIHRWDVIGDDEYGIESMSNHELLDHAVRLYSGAFVERGLHSRPNRTGLRKATFVFSTGRGQDLIVEDQGNKTSATISLANLGTVSGYTFTSRPSDRLLMLWGRRPSDPSQVQFDGPMDELRRAQQLLQGW